MTSVFAHPFPNALRGPGAGAGLRRWLRHVLFLHMDLWPWSAVATVPPHTLATRNAGGRRQTEPDDDRCPSSSSDRFRHEPVLLAEAMHHLRPAPGKLFLDATLGGGGHSAALLAAGADVLGLDQDAAAIAGARDRLAGHEDHFVALRLNFRNFAEVLDETGISGLDGILADLGASSHQFDTADRGFSLQQDGPLDMRMDPSGSRTAADIVNECSAEELARIFAENGEEPLARRVARAIVRRRTQRPFRRTLDLAETVASVLPRRGRVHPATRVFQALRIELNDELGALRNLLEQAPRHLKPGGRIVVISFHSLEDRCVKQSFARQSAEWIDRPEWPAPRPNPDRCLRLLTRKPVEPGPEEISTNPRARSARLRAAEKLPS